MSSTIAGRAIDFALDRLEPWEAPEFLSDFRKGNLKSYPDFLEFLREVETPSIPSNGATP